MLIGYPAGHRICPRLLATKHLDHAMDRTGGHRFDIPARRSAVSYLQ